ncbi:hypothetical protein [Xenorhabdus eapokensis]|nr:hypothetical protein [Xenorhabdus eapokensis]
MKKPYLIFLRGGGVAGSAGAGTVVYGTADVANARALREQTQP